MTAQHFDKELSAFEDADRRLDIYQGLLYRAAKGLECERSRFHIYNIQGPEFCSPGDSLLEDGMDGATFPNAEKIAKAICAKAKARANMLTFWSKLSPEEQASRQVPV